MTEANRAASDLEYVRQVVERRGEKRNLSPRWLGIMWGTLVLIGCTWNDVHPQTCWMFWAVVPTVAWVLSTVFLGKEAFMMGEWDARTGQRMGMHWSTCFFAGVPVVMMAFAGRIGGCEMGQLLILISGIVYYLGGVHFDRRWMVPGLVMMVGSVVPTFVNRGGWTAVGVMTFLALVVSFWRAPKARAEEGK